MATWLVRVGDAFSVHRVIACRKLPGRCETSAWATWPANSYLCCPLDMTAYLQPYSYAAAL